MIIKSDKLYAALKWVALVLLPAVATLIFALGGVWEWDFKDKLVGTLAAIDTFIGVIIRVSSKQYYGNPDNFDGDLIIAEGSGEMPEVNAIFSDNPSTFKGKDVVTLRTKVMDLEAKDPLQGI